MKGEDHAEFDKENRRIIREFISDAEKHMDDLSGSVIATMTQFIMNLRITIRKKAHQEGQGAWVTPIEILDAQIEEMRRCIVDLQNYKERLIKGVTKQ